MTAPVDNSFYADFQGLSSLRRDARAADPTAVREAARQFESLFTQMMLKSMRAATPQDSLFGSDQQDFYQDLFDTQMATQLSRGKGLGLADMLVRQLMQAGGAGAAATDGAEPAQAAAAPSAAATAPRGDAADEAQRRGFIESLRPAARAAAAQLGVDESTLLAHAALETGWGRSLPQTAEGHSSFNFFGIKAGAGWDGAVASSRTREFEQGQPVSRTERFRAYGSAEECLQDYARLIGGNPRYAGARGTGGDVGAFATALQRGGYATDPDYARKLTQLAAQLKSADARPITRSDTA